MHAATISDVSRAPVVSVHPPNVVDLVLEHSRRTPDAPALIVPGAGGARIVRYGDLIARSARYAAALDSAGVRAGARVLVVMRPDPELYALVLAILSGGMTLVVIDGRVGARRLLGLLGDAAPDAVIATPSLMRWWPLVGALRRARRFTIGGTTLGARPIALHARGVATPLEPRKVARGTAAVVSFSSGNTGRSKAVVRTHTVLLAQHRALAAAVPLDAADVNLPGFPMATLHNLCCGTASIIPPADLRAMADAEPAAIAALIERHAVTSLSGAPAFVGELARHIIREGRTAGSIRRLVVGGGPVGRALCTDIRTAFPAAEARVVYGATEAEPITSVTVDEVAAERDREGILVGVPVDGTEVCLLAANGSHASVGEVAVRGEQVASERAWHRTGDIGRFDANGRLWLLGRVDTAVSHHGCMLYPYAVEADALSLHGVRAAALVTHSRAPAGELVVEPEIGADDGALLRDLRGILAERGLPELAVRVIDDIPMDARHASKVARSALIALLERADR
jgi:acyl-CoA synthetase (AMP-forming)/AMP-acid ligase II